MHGKGEKSLSHQYPTNIRVSNLILHYCRVILRIFLGISNSIAKSPLKEIILDSRSFQVTCPGCPPAVTRSLL